MTTKKLVRGKAIRVTKLDGCGNPVLGPDSQVATDGTITTGLTAVNNEGEAITQTNANGENCILDQPTPKFQNWIVSVQMCGVDPELFTLMTGQPVVFDADDNPIGFDIESDLDVDLLGFSLEMWTGMSVDACDSNAGVSYGYMVVPFLKGGTIGDLAVENAAINFTVSGATSKDGAQWGNGPYDVQLDEDGEPGPLLDALSTKNHMRMIEVGVAPPANTDGAEALGVPATGANVSATIKAVLAPANAYAPLNLADIAAHPVTATPATAWVTGKYMLLRDGSKVHWNATAWVAGAA